MKQTTKKIIAREYLFLLGSIILFFIILFLWMFLESRNDRKISEIQNEIATIEKEFQINNLDLNKIFDFKENSEKLYQVINERSLYTKSFEEFNEQFSSKEKQIKLYNGVKEEGLYTKSQKEFLNEYFSYPENNIEKELQKLLYEAKDNGTSYSRINEIIYRYLAKNNDSYKQNLERVKELKVELKGRKESFFNSGIYKDNVIGLGLLIFSIVFCFRYLIYAAKWSFMQLKK